MEVRRCGERALLIECGDHGEVAAVLAAARERAPAWGAVEVVPAARTVLVDGVADPGGALAEISAWTAMGPGARELRGREIELAVRYDGPDLDEVARQWGVTPAEVALLHQETVFEVAFCGFAPGFAYCTGLGADREVRRRADPRPAVPAGSVGLAGEYTGIYPTSSPGGWQLIGRVVGARLWRPSEPSPALLTPGDTVRFAGV